MKFRSPRSPPKNYKVNFVDGLTLSAAEKNYLTSLVPKIGRAFTSSEENQLELSK